MDRLLDGSGHTQFGSPPKYGSGFVKHQRSDPGFEQDNTNTKQHMLSFSTINNNNNSNNNNDNKNGQNVVLSYFQQPCNCNTPSYNKGYNSGSMHGCFTGIKGPFTPAQWIELEHQAMIYKYLTANVPVPPNLLTPIRKALSSSGFSGFSIGSYPAHSYGWGAFHLGFSGSTDPELGRCRRTDGKKWRCSRDAVPDQKYCERHINRGRHRSRKPVEGHTGQAANGTTNTKVVVPPISGSMPSNGSASNNLSIAHQHQIKGLQPNGATNGSTNSIVNRFHDEQGLTMMHQPMNLKTDNDPFSVAKQHIHLDQSLQSEFGLVSTDSLMNPTQKTTYMGCKTYNNSILEFNNQPTQDEYPLRHFMDIWPKDNATRSPIHWPENPKSDWTQLSMSIPTDFSSSSSSNQEKIIAWGNSIGGPLGEVLNNTGHITSTLNFNGEWCNDSPQLGSSPTGVLQRSTFVSLSNSSSTGSPRGDSKLTLEGASLCDDILGSMAHTSSTSIPSM